jgi:hypothetical protein
MKKLILTSILFFCVTTTFAQELPAIPMKNGMAYYTFEHKLDNTTNCLSKYFDPFGGKSLSLNTKIAESNRVFNSKISKDKIGFGLSATSSKPNLKCSDTISNVNGISFGRGSEVLWRPAVIEFLRKKVIKSVIKGNISIVFISKNEYRLVVKDIVYTVDYIKSGQHGIDTYKIGELYDELKNSDKVSKDDIKFFNELNFFIKSADEIILKALTDTYQADEL